MDLTVGQRARRPRTSPSRGRVRPTPRRLAGAGYAIAGMVAAACYSSFLVAWPLGSRLSVTGSYVSELEAPGQPASGFFRLTDLVGGLFIVVLAVALVVRLWPEVRGTTGGLFLAVVGLAAAADGLDPMPCTPSTSQTCHRQIDQVAIIVQLHQWHTVSSILGACSAMTAMLLLGVSRQVRRWRPWLGRASLAGGLLLVMLGLSEVPMTVGHGVGAVERLHVALISAWITALGWQLFRSPRAVEDHAAENSPVPLRRRETRVGQPDGRDPRRRRHLLPLPTAGGRRAGRVGG